jgi:nucleotide-binding universal stress UspA family protein
MADAPSARRLLLPIDASAPSRWAIRHVLRRAAAGEALTVCLLYAVPPAGHWEGVRFRSERELSEFAHSRAVAFLDAAAAELQQAGVPCTQLVREDEPATSVLELAAEQGCDAIVLPRPEWFDWFARALTRRLCRSAPDIPVTLVDAHGNPTPH